MAHIEFLREQMERDWEVMNDKSKPFDVRRVARIRFYHCEKRVGTMERGGFTEDNPGHFLIGYGEEDFYGKTKKKAAPEPAPSVKEQRRDLKDQQTEAHFRAKERL